MFLHEKNVYNMFLYNSLNCYAVVTHGKYQMEFWDKDDGGGGYCNILSIV